MEKEEEAENGDKIKKKVPFMKPSWVFNLDQTTIKVEEEIPQNKGVALETAENIIETLTDKPTIINGVYPAYYPLRDTIQTPPIHDFTTPEEYYATLFHELGHSTGLEHRLNRKGITSKTIFGHDDYSFEELVAEMCSAYLSCWSGIEQTQDNSRAYIQGWLNALQNDKNLLVQASAKGREASDYILKNSKSNLIQTLE
jgi:antirestriction protein ArdC